MRVLRLLLAGVVFAPLLFGLSLAGSAGAAPQELVLYVDDRGAPHFHGERDALSNPVVRRLVEGGARYIRDEHGIDVCLENMRMAPDLGDVPGEGRAAGRAWRCDVWVLTEYVARANSLDEGWVSALCAVLMHELAHTAGIDHGLVMDALHEESFNPWCLDEAERIWREACQFRWLLRSRRRAQANEEWLARRAVLVRKSKARRR